MNRMCSACFVWFFSLFLLSAAFQASPGDTTMDKHFEELAERYIDRFPALAPVSATSLGDHRFDTELDQISEAARTHEVRFLQEYLGQLDRIDPANLSRSNQVDYALLEHHLEAQRWQIEQLQEWAWNPLLYTGLVGNAVYGLLARDFAPLETRLACVAARLEEFPRLFAQIRATLVPERVPEVHAETAIKQNRGVLNILDNVVEPHLAELPAADQERLERAMETGRRAVEKHQKWLESELLPKAGGEFRLGAELYDKKLAFSLQTPLTRQQIRARAERRLRQVRNQMYDIAKEVYRTRYPYTDFPAEPSDAYKRAIIRACLEMAYSELPEPDGIVQAANRSLELATTFVRENDLVTIPPDPLEIIIMPEYKRGVSLAYCDSPGPLEDVGQKTFYAVAPLPEDWTPEQVHSFLREYNLRSIHNLTVHEAMPGHFLQLAHSNRYPGVLRALLASGTFIEGWAEYTEWMMCEQGFLDGDPLMRLIVLKWYLRATTNAIIDQAIHVDGMTRDEAMRLMVENAFQEEREASAKWRRAQLTSVQLSTYFVGYQEHTDLRREAEQKWGDKFNLKEYHDRVLSFGSPPVKFVRALLLNTEIPR